MGNGTSRIKDIFLTAEDARQFVGSGEFKFLLDFQKSRFYCLFRSPFVFVAGKQVILEPRHEGFENQSLQLTKLEEHPKQSVLGKFSQSSISSAESTSSGRQSPCEFPLPLPVDRTCARYARSKSHSSASTHIRVFLLAGGITKKLA